MFGSILHRMIFRELIRVFLLSLLGITGILLMAGIVAEASQQGLSPGQILAVIPLLIPSTLPYTIPATTLFATCVVYGRLAADNEILAMRASGINMTVAVWPGIMLGLVTSVATLGLYYHLIPYTHHVMRTMFLNDVEELLYTMLRKQNQISYPHLNYSIYVRGLQGKRLINPTFKRRDARGDTDLVATGLEADLLVDKNKEVILVHMKDGSVWTKDGTAEFEDRVFDVPLPGSVSQDYRRPRDMTWVELYELDDKLQATYEQVKEELAQGERRVSLPGATEEERMQAKLIRMKAKACRLAVNGIVAEKLMRPALAFGCLFFVMIGCPVGIWFSRSDYLSSFITCFIPIVIVYYPLVLCGTSMAKEGRPFPAVYVWAADGVMAFIGLMMFRRLLKH